MAPPKEFRFLAERIRAEMAEAGFAQIEEHSFLPQQLFMVFAVR
jgi:hypothetical protein